MMITQQDRLPRYCSRYLRDNEVFATFARKSLGGYMGTWVVSVACILAAFFLMFLLLQNGEWGLLAFAALIVFGAGLGVRRYVLWYYTGLLITDRRVVDFDQHGLFERTLTEASMDTIEDVNISQRGVLAVTQGFGTLYIHTKGSKPDIEVTGLPHPEKVLDIIANYQR